MAGFWYSSFCQKTSRKMDIMKGQLLRPCSYHFHAFPRRLPIRNPGPSSGCSLVAENDGFLRSLEELQNRWFSERNRRSGLAETSGARDARADTQESEAFEDLIRGVATSHPRPPPPRPDKGLSTPARSVNSLRQPQPARPRLSQLSDERGSGCGWPLVCRSPE